METFRGGKNSESETNRIRKKLTRLASVAVLAAGLMIAPSVAKAASGSVEVMPGQEASVLDAKLSLPIAGRASLFFRHREAVDYRSKTTPFTLMDTLCSVGRGFDAFFEMQSTDGKLVKRIGIQYVGTFKDLTAVLAPTVSLERETDFSTQMILKFSPLVSEKVRLLAKIEAFSFQDKVGYLSTIGRVRLGLEKGGISGGFAFDASRFRGVGKTDRNIGAFVQKEF